MKYLLLLFLLACSPVSKPKLIYPWKSGDKVCLRDKTSFYSECVGTLAHSDREGSYLVNFYCPRGPDYSHWTKADELITMQENCK